MFAIHPLVAGRASNVLSSEGVKVCCDGMYLSYLNAQVPQRKQMSECRPQLHVDTIALDYGAGYLYINTEFRERHQLIRIM